MKKPGWDDSSSAAGNARLRLPALARAYFAGGRNVTEARLRPAALHRFRLDTKAFRYTLELFAPCYGPGLDRRLGVLRKIQAYLGTINDYATTAELVAEHLPDGDPERTRLEGLLSARAKRKTMEFRRFAGRFFHDGSEERRWVRYLSRLRPD